MFEKEIIMIVISKQVSNILKYNKILKFKSHAKPCNYHLQENKSHVCWTTFSRSQCCATLDDLSLILNHYMFVKLPSDWFYQNFYQNQLIH